MQQPVTCDTLGALDNGSARAIINRAILEAVTDLDDRAADDDKPRKVVIELTFERRKNSDVEVSVEAIAKVPSWTSRCTTGHRNHPSPSPCSLRAGRTGVQTCRESIAENIASGDWKGAQHG